MIIKEDPSSPSHTQQDEIQEQIEDETQHVPTETPTRQMTKLSDACFTFVDLSPAKSVRASNDKIERMQRTMKTTTTNNDLSFVGVDVYTEEDEEEEYEPVESPIATKNITPLALQKNDSQVSIRAKSVKSGKSKIVIPWQLQMMFKHKSNQSVTENQEQPTKIQNAVMAIPELDPNLEVIIKGERRTVKEFIGSIGVKALLNERGGLPDYTFASSTHASGFNQCIMIGLYKKAKKLHQEWIDNKKEANKLPKVKQLSTRLDQTRELDDNHSPYLFKINECLKMIEEMEADRKGSSSEKTMSNFDKYRLSVIYMGMLQDPNKFRYLERFIPSDDKNVKLQLPTPDREKFFKLKEEIAKNDEIKENLRQQRQENLTKARNEEGIYGKYAKLFTQENKDRLVLINRLNDPELSKLQIKDNPMLGSTSKVAFTEKKRKIKYNKGRVKRQQKREQSGWNFIQQSESKISMLSQPGEVFKKRRHTVANSSRFHTLDSKSSGSPSQKSPGHTIDAIKLLDVELFQSPVPTQGQAPKHKNRTKVKICEKAASAAKESPLKFDRTIPKSGIHLPQLTPSGPKLESNRSQLNHSPTDHLINHTANDIITPKNLIIQPKVSFNALPRIFNKDESVQQVVANAMNSSAGDGLNEYLEDFVNSSVAAGRHKKKSVTRNFSKEFELSGHKHAVNISNLTGVFSSKFVVSKQGLFDQPKHSATMMKDTSLDLFSMVSRDRRNQKTLNTIKHSETKLRAHLRMISRDITNNVLKEHKDSNRRQSGKIKNKVTIQELEGVEDALLEMDEKLDKLQENKFWNKTSVKEQAQRIRQFVKKRKDRSLEK